MIYIALSFLFSIMLLVILYLLRLHIGLKADAAVRVKNNAALTKQLKVFDEAIQKLQKQIRNR